VEWGMSRNVGPKDAVTRGVIAVLLVSLGVFSRIPAYLSFAAILVGIVLMATALTRECPLYRALHIATLRSHHHHI
jgi:Inner membrane protein YgaP-like, transmembrane domain